MQVNFENPAAIPLAFFRVCCYGHAAWGDHVMISANWRESVDEVERGLSECLAALDRYEQSFTGVLTAEPVPAEERPRILEGRISGWSERLATAGERAAAVERLISEQQEIWIHWQSAVGRWKASLKQLPVIASAGRE
jgi:hypothetical protein